MGKPKGAEQQVTEYRLSIHFGVSFSLDTIRKVRVNEKVVWQGAVEKAGGVKSIPVSNAYLFGGPQKEGGVDGVIHFLPGRADQLMPAAVATRLNKTPETTIAYRGLTTFYMTGRKPGEGFLWGTTPIVAQTVDVTGTFIPKGLNPATATVENPELPGMPDANPIHIIYDVATDPAEGIMRPEDIGYASFNAAAQTLFNEGVGLSFAWTRPMQAENLINELQAHINSVCYTDPDTGLFDIKLIRDDYNVADLFEINASNAKLVKFERKFPGETVNEIVVTYTDPLKEKDATLTVHAQGAASVVGVISDSRNFYAFRRADLAEAAGWRELRAANAPLAAVNVVMNREGWNRRPGEPVRVYFPDAENPDRTIDIIARVGEIEYGEDGDSDIPISLTEDIFSLVRPPAARGQPSEWIDPSDPPTPVSAQLAFTLPNFMLLSPAYQERVTNLEYPEVVAMVLAHHVSYDALDFNLLDAEVQPTGELEVTSAGSKTFTERGALLQSLPPEPSSQVLLSTLPLGRGPRIGGFVLMGDAETTQEIALIRAFDGFQYTLDRGVLDTIPRQWPNGTPVWYVNPNTRIVDDRTVRSAGETVVYRLLPRTSLGELPFADATPLNATMTERPHLPLRPADVRINGVSIGGTVNVAAVNNISITWATRNRVLEDGQVVAWGAAPVAPEYKQRTIILVTDTAGNELRRFVHLWTDNAFVIPKAWFARWSAIRVYVFAEREGLTSLQAMRFDVTGLAGDAGAAEPPVAPDAGTPPPPVVAPEEGRFTVIGGYNEDPNGAATIPALFVRGRRNNPDAAGLVVRYARRSTEPNYDWQYYPAATLDERELYLPITAVASSTEYRVEVAYVVNGVVGFFLFIGYAVTGKLISESTNDLGGVPAQVLLDQLASAEALAAGVAAQVADLEQVYGDTASAAQSAADAAAAQAGAAQAKADAVVARGEARTAAEDALAKAQAAAGSSAAADAAKTASETARGQAQTYASNASDSADTAAGAASTATQQAGLATTARNAAEGSADAAAGSASIASSKADASGQSASAAEAARVAAKSSQDAAKGSADAASTSASTAATKATEAGTSASAANTAKTAAETARSQAQTFRDEASDSADDANGAAATATQQAGLATTARNDAAGSASAALTSRNQASGFATAAETAAAVSTTQKLEAVAALNAMGRQNIVARENVSTPADVFTVTTGGVSGWGFSMVGSGGVVVREIKVGPLKKNTAYSVSFLARRTAGTTSLPILIDLFPDSLPETSINVASPSWTRYTWEGITSASDDMALSTVLLRFFRTLPAGNAFEITDIKLEEGATATAWTPSSKDAATSAKASAQSASQASASETAAGQQAATATQARIDAQTARGQAEGFRNQAVQAYQDAQGQASIATTQAGLASGSATLAGDKARAASESASLASTKADAAGTSAQAAEVSKLQASSSYDAAAQLLYQQFPPTLAPDSRGSYEGYGSIAGPSDWPTPYISVEEAGTITYREFRHKRRIPKLAGKRYRFECWVFTYATNVRFSVHRHDYPNQTGTAGSRYRGQMPAAPTGSTNVKPPTHTFTLVAGEFEVLSDDQAFLGPYLAAETDNGQPSNGLVHIGGIAITDITSEKKATTAAEAAVIQASSAATFAGQSEDWAKASKEQAILASGSAGNAKTYRDESATARDGSVIASSSASLSAAASDTARDLSEKARDLSEKARDKALEHRNAASTQAGIAEDKAAEASASASAASISASLAASTSAVRGNLLPNGGMERGLEGISGPNLYVSNDSWGPAVRVAPTGNGTYTVDWAPVNIFAGATYTVSGDALLFADSGQRYFDMIWLNSAGNVVGDSGQKPMGPGDYSNDRARINDMAFSAQAPSNATRVVVRAIFEGTVNPTALGARRVKLELGNAPATAYTADAAVGALSAKLNITAGVAADVQSRLASARFEVIAAAGNDPAQLQVAADGSGSLIGLIASQLSFSNVVNGVIVPVMRLINGNVVITGKLYVGLGSGGGYILIDGPNMRIDIFDEQGRLKFRIGKLD